MPPPRAMLRHPRALTSVPSSALSAQRLVPSLQAASTPSSSQSTAAYPSASQSRYLTLQISSSSSPQAIQARSFSSTAARLESHSHYDPPGGWLWGVPPGQKPEKEGWESIWFWGFWGSMFVTAVAYVFKPDTSIQTWALEEARRRLEKEGILPDPDDEKK